MSDYFIFIDTILNRWHIYCGLVGKNKSAVLAWIRVDISLFGRLEIKI